MARTGLAAKEDLPAVFSLLEEGGLPEEGLSEHLGTILVAREGGEVVGSAALELHGEAVLLRSAAIRRELRGRGLGRQLSCAALELASQRGAKVVYLLTAGYRGFLRSAGLPAGLAGRGATGFAGGEPFGRVCLRLPRQRSSDGSIPCRVAGSPSYEEHSEGLGRLVRG